MFLPCPKHSQKNNTLVFQALQKVQDMEQFRKFISLPTPYLASEEVYG